MKRAGAILYLALTLISAGMSTLAMARAPMSPVRGVDESYQDAANRSHVKIFNFGQQQQFRYGMSAYDERVARFEDLDLTQVSDIGTLQKLQEVFERYRDKRYLADPDEPLFSRRISWMFPDDGCFARAELLGRLLEHDTNPAISKLFVFGDLKAKTPNHPSGEVQWWYHVAAAYRLGTELYVLDPSVEPKKPITDHEWGRRVGDRGTNGATSLEWALCSTHTLDPGADCQSPVEESEDDIKALTRPFLQAERLRAKELGRVADDVLGDLPPWRSTVNELSSPSPEKRSPSP